MEANLARVYRKVGIGRLAAQVRESIAELELEGKQVRYLHATTVPRDESFLLVLEAASEELVRELRFDLDDPRRRSLRRGQQPKRNRSEGGQIESEHPSTVVMSNLVYAVRRLTRVEER